MIDYKLSVVKEKGEKLLKVYVKSSDTHIEDIVISGDFFLHPEEGLEVLEKSLQGVEFEMDSIISKIVETVYNNGIEMVGISPRSIALAIIDSQRN